MPSVGAWLVSCLCLASLLGNVAAGPLPEDVAARWGSCKTVIKRKEWFASLISQFILHTNVQWVEQEDIVQG